MTDDDNPRMDRHGTPADSTLFFDRMPQSFSQAEMQKLIDERCGRECGLKNIWFGTKPLGPGEFRTASAKFHSTDDAVRCRSALQHYQGVGAQPRAFPREGSEGLGPGGNWGGEST